MLLLHCILCSICFRSENIMATGYCIGAHILTCKARGGQGTWPTVFEISQQNSSLYQKLRGDASLASKEWWKCSGCQRLLPINLPRKIGLHTLCCEHSAASLFEGYNINPVRFKISKDQRYHCPKTGCSHRSRWKSSIIHHYFSSHSLVYKCRTCHIYLKATADTVGSHLLGCKNESTGSCDQNDSLKTSTGSRRKQQIVERQHAPEEHEIILIDDSSEEMDVHASQEQSSSSSKAGNPAEDSATASGQAKPFITPDSLSWRGGQAHCPHPGCKVASCNKVYVCSHYYSNHLGKLTIRCNDFWII